ncbi:glutamate-cysteine ligase [Proteiniborus sp. DW1]|uniref:glutamate--cysteine ligase n=1 Tax=Proteiniborus sp. DW1 TaxID=1889883 RepID=UPI00092E00C5|nr:glutamate-cysteine ligase family protein [Proteiniborus sp. DW1]SCG81879.1 glutamate-cysteine ligase [Proteiniborus sp. DW1]
MDYKRKVQEVTKYFKNNEKKEEDFSIGVEFEHFIIDKETLKTISYYGIDGVEDTLMKLQAMGWKGKYEKDHILGLEKEAMTITLEPGSQIELSIKPYKNIEDIEKVYKNFLDEIVPILDAKGQTLITTGYQPESKITDIKMIPKQRYDYMFEYFKSRGKYAHNMMKGTASVQVSVDYGSEEDYIKKFKVANALSPVIYTMFDNSPFFEGRVTDKYCLRKTIWENCDDDRCGIVAGTFDESFGYEKYSDYILNFPPIFIDDSKSIRFTGSILYKDLFNPDEYSLQELEHVMTMVFPDVRTKKFMEIRMMDAVPYPLNFAAVALLKGLLYNESNLNAVYDYVNSLSKYDIDKARVDIIDEGLSARLKDREIHEVGKWLIGLSKKALNQSERDYLTPLEIMIDNKMTPSQITKEKLSLGKKEALEWCFVDNKLFEVMSCGCRKTY